MSANSETLKRCRIDFEVRLTGKPETPFIEAGHFVFPLNVRNHEIRINKTGSVVDPEKDIVKDANHGLFCCENWVDVSDGMCGGSGIAVLPFDTPLFSVGGDAILKYRRIPEKTGSRPELFFNLFNNSWGTNFLQWTGGDFVFRFRLFPHKGDWRDGRVQQMALESVTPVLTGFADGPAGNLDPSANLLELPEGAAAMALKPAYDGEGYVLRLRELNWTTASAGKCDLLERPLGGRGDSETAEMPAAQTELHPFGISSYRTHLQ